jgi:hypothetical protein
VIFSPSFSGTSSRQPSSLLAALLLTLLCTVMTARAHQVPNLTLEAEFSSSGEVEFRLNLDPRLFLAEDPKTLPPIPAPWYRDQTETEKADTLKQALAYVKAALTVFFDEQATGADWVWQFQPIDGATGESFTDDTAEVHLLAIMKTRCPAGGKACSVRLEDPAKAPTVLLNSLNQQAERRPQILFPGETSRPFLYLTEATPAPKPPPP